MEAFGSYGEETVIDFTKPNQNLFLVTGDTGAGKTTIFDAIVFALYGDVSSQDSGKKGRDLQSQYVDQAVEPFVELEFSEENDLYTVRRVPRHDRPIKKGKGKGGLKEVKENVSLLLPDGSEYPEKLAETNARIEEIVGLTRDQFLQVGMIAQGEFMRMLRVDSKERKEIFRRLFGTSVFMNITDILRERRRKAQTALDRVNTSLKTETGHVRRAYDDLAGAIERIQDADVPSVTDLEAVEKGLPDLSSSLENEADLEKGKVAELQKKRDTAHDALTQAKNLAGQFDLLAENEERLRELHLRDEEMQEKKVLKERIDAALEVKNAWEPFSQAEKEAAKTERGLKEADASLPGLAEALHAADEESERAKTARDAANDAYTAQKEKTGRALKLFESIEEHRASAAKLKKDAEVNEKKGKEAAAALETFEKQVQEWRETEKSLADAGVRAKELENRSEKLTAISDRQSRLLKDTKTLAREIGKVGKMQNAYVKARDACSKLDEEYRRKQNAYLDAQAGIIAREKLVEGQPCPVCGSLEHPHPCQIPAEAENITREDLDHLAKSVNEARAVQEKTSGEAGRQKELVNQKQTALLENLEDFEMRLHENPDMEGSSLPPLKKADVEEELIELHFLRELEKNLIAVGEELDERGKKLAQERKAVQGDVKKLTFVRDSLTGAEEKRTQLQADQKTAEAKATEAQVALASEQGALENLMAVRPYETPEAALADLKSAEKIKAEADKKAKRNEKAVDDIRGRQKETETLKAHFEEILPEQREDCAQKKQIYEETREEKGLQEDEWMDIAHSYTKKDSLAIEKDYRTFQDEILRTETALKAARNAVGEKEKPDIKAITETVKQADEALSKASESLSGLIKDLDVDRQCASDFAALMDSRRKAQSAYTTVSGLYNRLSGQVTGGRMDLETFVQRYYLSHILEAANRRFEEMSFGQFDLRMVPVEEAGQGRNRGLDLRVYSNITGKEREISTLSGGESFMAALSLALGMADQIQSSSAGIHLDMMFIDEGFGSLDDKARDEAVRVLKNMAGGSRLIGIISHVSELKQEIEDQLIVTRDDHGSHARWQIS